MCIRDSLKEIGLGGADCIFKSDQENAIGDLLNIIAKRRSALSKMEKANEEVVDGAAPVEPPDGFAEPRTIHEAAPVGSSQSNGFERAIQDEEGQIRTIKSWNRGLGPKSQALTT